MKKLIFLLAVSITLLNYQHIYAQTFVEDTIPNVFPLWGCSGAWTDYDNDGDKDLLLSGIDSNGYRNAKIYRNDSNSVFTDINANTILDGTSSGSVAWGDYNNDGLQDILITGYNGAFVLTKLYYQSGGTFIPDIITLPEVTLGEAKFGDYDNDGDLDIAITGLHAPLHGSWYNLAKIYRNDVGGVFTDINAPLIPLQNSSLDWGDMDNDGDLDLLLIGVDSNNVDHANIYRNDGSNIFTDISAGLTGVRGDVCKWGDYNNDGKLDLFITGYNGSIPKFIIYKNTGSNTFIPITTSIEGGPSGDADWGDYDNDGLLDIIISGNNSTIKVTHVYHNDGGDFFSLLPQSFPGLNTSTALWADYTGDGKLDFIISGETNTSGQILTKLYKQPSGTGITEHGQTIYNISIYPNPSSGKFSVGGKENISSIEITNILGEKVFATIVKQQISNEIDISDSPKGIYFVKMFDGEKIYTEKIVVK